MSNIAAGRLRHLVTIEEQVTLKNSFGETSLEWEPLGNFWAAIEPLSVRELNTAQQIQSEVTTRIVLRYNAAVKASMRIVYKGTIFNIYGVQRDPDSGLEWMTLPCSSGISDG